MKTHNVSSLFFSARSDLGMRMRVLKKIRETLGVVAAILFSSWLMFHTFSYDAATHEFRIAFKLWSDFAAHIPLIRSFSMGANYDRLIHGQPIEYPIFPGEPIRYHFFFDMIVGLLEKIGLRIDWALNIPSIIGFSSLLIAIYLVSVALFSSTAAAVLSVLFFLFNGSLSFIEFFKTHPLSLTTLTDILHARDFPAFAPWGPGDITAFWNLNIYTNQRHLAGAFALLCFFLFTCMRIETIPRARQYVWAGIWAILIGLLPYYHQPALLMIAVMIGWYFFFMPNARLFLLTTGIWSSLLVIPQIVFARTGASQFEWFPGYIIHGDLMALSPLEQIGRMVLFWWNNIGLHLILLLAGWPLLPKQAKRVLSVLFPIFLIGNLWKFSVEISANHKFFNFAMILGQMISAYILVLCMKKIKRFHRIIRLCVYSLISVFLMLLTLSGIIDFFVVKNDIIGSAKDILAFDSALWVANKTAKDAIFLNSSYMYHPASLAGRSVFLGWPYFAWSAGYDSYPRMAETKILYGSNEKTALCTLLTKHHIAFVTYQNDDRYVEIPFSNEPTYEKFFPLVYTNEEKSFRVYDVRSCQDR